MNLKKCRKFLDRHGLNAAIEPGNDDLIALFNSSIGSFNVGDEIINDSIRHELCKIFPKEQFLQLTTHDGVSSVGIGRANKAKFRFVCGSNLIGGKMYTNRQWNIGPLDILRLKEIITLGVGWQKYRNQTSWYSQWLFHTLLSKKWQHSVRDSYTLERLKAVGITNVINTGCPTTWMLTPEHQASIPTQKAEEVIFTLTDWRKDHAADNHLIRTLRQHYHKLHFWVQAARDIEYMQQLTEFKEDIHVIPPRLEEFDRLLSTSESLDYVGSRLHGGIRALQHGRRTIIIGVDNRALEKQRDIRLPVVAREHQEQQLEKLIQQTWVTELTLPEEAIASWKAQFA